MMGMATDAYVPMPMTEHPYYADQARGIREHLHLRAIRVMEAPKSLAAATESREPSPFGPSFGTRMLDVGTCMALAPFIGDPILNEARYEWKVAVDELGRHVSGEAALIWRFPPR